jgi:hypothetical protein
MIKFLRNIGTALKSRTVRNGLYSLIPGWGPFVGGLIEGGIASVGSPVPQAGEYPAELMAILSGIYAVRIIYGRWKATGNLEFK